MRFITAIIILCTSLVETVVEVYAETPESTLSLSRRIFLHFSQVSIENNSVKLAIFDADSTLRVSRSGAPSPNSPDDFVVLPFTPEKIRELNAKGYLVAIMSDQAGVSKFITRETADAALFNLVRQLRDQGALVHYYDFSETYDVNRKPDIGMATRLMQKLRESFPEIKFDLAHSIVVGNGAYMKHEFRPDGSRGFNHSNADRRFAQNLKIKFIEASEFFGWIDHGIYEFNRIEEVREFVSKHPELSFARSYCNDLLE